MFSPSLPPESCTTSRIRSSSTPGIEPIPGNAIGSPNAERCRNAGSATLAEASVSPVERKWRRV
ncbi:MAG: hypothetical protein IPJ41_06730 [Phycisphaerales bacterium]|nr:hypothetical protein [Phycisphaerales bacterium]